MKTYICSLLLAAVCLSMPSFGGTSESVMKEVQRYVDAGNKAREAEDNHGFAVNLLRATQVKGLVNPERRVVDQTAIVVLTQCGYFNDAIPIIEREANQGNLRCQAMMGSVYYNGLGGKPQNREKGIAMLRKAAQLGDAYAQQTLFKMGLRW